MNIKEISYLAPEGEYAGTIISGNVNTDEKNGKVRESVKLTIALDPILGHNMNDYRVRADYWTTQGRQFFEDAQKLIGSAAYELTDGDGNIMPWKLSLLEGQRVRVTVIHERKPGFKEPYRKVIKLRPLGPAELKRAA